MRVSILSDRLIEAARRARFATTIYGRVGEFELPAFTRPGKSDDAPHFYISSGIHGDEPAGPLAILDLLRRRAFPEDCAFTLVPLINPLALDRRGREHPEGLDLNRDYGLNTRTAEIQYHKEWLANRRFDYAFCLHEDYEANGAYLYALSDETSALASRLLTAMSVHVGVDASPLIDGLAAASGIILPPLDRAEVMRDSLPEALYLWPRRAPHVFTLETPSAKNIVQRVDAHVAALEEAFESTRQRAD